MTDLRPDETGVPTPPRINDPTPWHRKWITWVAVASALALIAAFVVFVWKPGQSEPTVRVSDGSDPFVGYLGKVAGLIHAENNRVTGSGKEYMSIAFMLPIRTGGLDPNTETAIRHEIEGAYLAQFWANHQGADGGQFNNSAPLVRLLLADTGHFGDAWSETVGQLAGRIGSERLVAVAGLGSSVATTQAAATALAEKGLPMFGAVITSSTLKARNLARVGPVNADYAAAAIKYLETTPEWRAATPAAPFKAFLVRDTTPGDSYAHDLGEAYVNDFPKNDPAHIMLPNQGAFNGSVGAVGNTLSTHVNAICTLDPSIVFFAGRSGHMREFLSKLAARPCAATAGPVTVMSGDDIDHLTDNKGLWAGDGLTLLYTGLASPLSWDVPGTAQAISAETVAHFRGPNPNSYAIQFGDSLEDGHAIMAHDSVLTATEAARRAYTGQPLAPPDLENGMNQITGTNGAVAGASGWIYFQNTKEPLEWLPRNKAIPVLSLDRDGKTTLVRLSSRTGEPPGQPTAR
jgi:ABC-type branched-subunit amino acid transport system substrate-binding protein